MSMNFEAFFGTLGLDTSEFVAGCESSGRSLTKFSGETLATFTSMAKASGRSLYEVTSSAEELAAVLGVEVHDAALILAESLNDPTVGLDLLSKAGVQFTDTQREQITTLTESGRVFEAQGQLIDLVREQYVAAGHAANEFVDSATEAAHAPTPDAGPAATGGSSMPFGLSPSMIKGGALIAIAKEAVDAFSEAELAAERFAAITEATGNASGYSLDKLQKLGAELQDIAAIEDDSVVAAGAFLETLKTIQGTNFDRTIRSSADLAAAMGTDISSAVEMLGRALADPEAGMARLTRAGIYLTDVQKDQVKAFVAVNDVASAQALVLDVVDGKVGGVAARIGGTFAKSVEKIKIQIGELFEELGQGLANLDREFGVLEKLKLIFQHIGSMISLISNGLAGLGAMIRGDFKAVESYANKLMATLLDVRARIAEVWQSKEVADGLREQAESYRKIAQSIDFARDRQESLNEARKAANNIPAPGMPVVRLSEGSSSPSRPAAPSHAASQASGSPPSATLASRNAAADSAAAFASSPEGAADLAAAGTDRARDYVDAMKAEIEQYGKSSDLVFNWHAMKIEGTSQADIDAILARYKSLVSQMPGFNETAWRKIEETTNESLRKAAKSQGDQKDFYLTNAQNAVASAAKMFDTFDTQAEESIRRAEQATAEAKKKIEADAKSAAKAAEKQSPGERAMHAKASEKSKQGLTIPPDEFANMQKMTKNELQKKIAASGQQFQNALGVAGISPEQKRGLKSLSDEYQATMVRIKNSTGDARAANIEQLKVITDAWAKTYQAIRDGSKKTVEQLIADAKKEGDIGKQTAGQRAMSAKEKRQNIIAARQADDALMGGGGGGMMDSIFGMAQQMSGFFSNAMSGIGAGAAALEAIMQQTTDPAARLRIEMENVAAQLQAATLNAHAFGGGIQAVNALQKDLDRLQQRMTGILRQETEERIQAEKRHSEAYKARELEKEERAKQDRREAGYDLASLVAVGDKKQAVTFNIYGAGDVREQADRIEHEMIRRGINVGAKRSLDSK